MVGIRVSRWSGVAVAAVILGLLSPLTPASAVPPLPYAQIDSPSAGTVAAGPVHVTGEGHLDAGAAYGHCGVADPEGRRHGHR